MEKRRLASNFMNDLLYSYPGRNTVRRDECTMRQIVACAVCAIKDWIDDFYPCYMWRDPPASAGVGASEHDSDNDTDEEVKHARAHPKGPQLRDENGFCYFGPAEKIHELLDVNLYVAVVPLAPLEELHASSAQHPRFQTMRWLLNTQRVPVSRTADATATERTDDVPESTTGDAVSGATEHAKPSCAGIGDPDKPAWICHHCASHLCSPQPRMPPQALANWNWGGREHPKYQNLSMAMKSLLGLVKLIMRMVLLKPTDNTEESEKALVGNTILVAQPSPAMIAAELPPTEAEQATYFNVVYGAGASEHASSKLNKKKALTIERQEYLECARIRAERCPLFADHIINVAEADNRLPENGVPPGIMRGAVEMETLQYFEPNLSGPATNQTPFSADNDEDNADNAEDPLDEADLQENGDSGCCRAPDALIAEENANAEFLIGLDGSPDDDAVGKLAAFRAKAQLAEEAQKRISAATKRTHEASVAGNDPSKAMESATDLAALLADHKSVCVDMRASAISGHRSLPTRDRRECDGRAQKKQPSHIAHSHRSSYEHL